MRVSATDINEHGKTDDVRAWSRKGNIVSHMWELKELVI